MFEKRFLFLQLVLYSIRLYGNVIHRSVLNSLRRLLHRVLGTKPLPPADRKGSIVIIGASFAGYHAAHIISTSLPPNSPYDVVIIEPNSHFQFTWVLPRFSVVEGHEHKAFIPYGPYLKGAPRGLVRWVRDRVVRVDRSTVRLSGGEEIPYAFLILATGSAQQNNTLPSRVGAEDNATGVEKLRGLQTRIREANRVVVLGGGAAGAELAADTKELYPHKEVILVHSRDAVMHRFGPELQAAALEGLQGLGVEVILRERARRDAELNGSGECLLLGSGRVLKCDYVVSAVWIRTPPCCELKEYDRLIVPVKNPCHTCLQNSVHKQSPSQDMSVFVLRCKSPTAGWPTSMPAVM